MPRLSAIDNTESKKNRNPASSQSILVSGLWQLSLKGGLGDSVGPAEKYKVPGYRNSRPKSLVSF